MAKKSPTKSQSSKAQFAPTASATASHAEDPKMEVFGQDGETVYIIKKVNKKGTRQYRWVKKVTE
jgi:hypothetical protein